MHRSMSSKLDYLKRYSGKKVKKRRKEKEKKSNLNIVDDDFNLESTTAKNEQGVDSGNSDDDPLVAEVHDDTVVKWQPLEKVHDGELDDSQAQNDPSPSKEEGVSPGDLSPPRRYSILQKDLSPPRQSSISSVLVQEESSPPRLLLGEPSPSLRPSLPGQVKGDLSPPRQLRSCNRQLEQHLTPHQNNEDCSPPRHQSSLLNEGQKVRSMYSKMEHAKVDTTGKFAETVYREKDKKQPNGAKERDEYLKQKTEEFAVWGRG